MGVGICLGGCCSDPACAQLQNCDTLETLTTRSDLSAYSVGDVLARNVFEGGGCWELLSFNAACDEEPQEFTVEGEPYQGETACQDCLQANCICCGESCALKAAGTWGFFILNEDTSEGVGCLDDQPLPFGGASWGGSSDACGAAIEFEIYCGSEGEWLMDIQIGTIVNLTEVPVQGPGNWAIFWSDSQADYRGQFGCCNDTEMTAAADSVGISVNIPECPA